jgi:hypothetical protein
MSRHALHELKGLGYLISAVSVAMLAVVNSSSAHKSVLLSVCLLGGAATSVIGMFCRWLSYELEKRMKESDRRAPGRK